MLKSRWKKLRAGPLKNIPGSSFSWAGAIHNGTKGQRMIYPRVSRIQNVGAVGGVHVPNPTWHAANHHVPVGAWDVGLYQQPLGQWGPPRVS